MGFAAGSVVEKNNKDQHTTQKYKIKRLEEHVDIVVSLTEPDTELTLDYAKLIEYIVNKSAKAKVTIRNNIPFFFFFANKNYYFNLIFWSQIPALCGCDPRNQSDS
jgi:hypothetical protein